MSGKSNEKLFCRELALSADPLFRISHVFADRDVSDRLMALYAFFAAIDEACSAISDEDVAVRKIAWWKAEADAFRKGEGTHPVSKELLRSGAAGTMPANWVMKLIASAGSRLEATPPATMDEFAGICLDAGMLRLQLELAVCGVESAGEETLRGIALRRGVYTLILASLHASAEKKFWWIPSSLMARHGLSRAALLMPEHEESVRSICTEMLEISDIFSPLNEVTISDISNKKQYIRNILSYDALVVSKLQYTNKNSYILNRKYWNKARLRDLLTCWRAARKVSLWK